MRVRGAERPPAARPFSTQSGIGTRTCRQRGKVKWLTGKVKVRFLLNFAIEGTTHESSREEGSVRKISNVAVAGIVAIALYFALAWGYDGLRILTSPSYGLEDVWRSQFVFAIGRLFNLGPIGLIKLAAFFGALKLAVACICIVHIVDRFRCMVRGQPDSKILEAGLILAVIISVAAIGPAFWTHTSDLIREHSVQLLIAAVAIGLCIFERGRSAREANAEIKADVVVDKDAARAAPRYHA